MIVDCERCAVRGPACSGCVVTVLLGMPPQSGSPQVTAPRAAPTAVPVGVPVVGRRWLEESGALLEAPADGLDDAERAALDVLAGAGLVPRLRLVPVAAPRPDAAACEARSGSRPPAYDARRGATRAG
ncbi:hypothetical protein [Pseudokineococcus sp. 1T1Z-3]|uniref:hypothetical protein n=1 Tax=Pseudokineococcus sp. 1T1Z-3 TaxID=3132745 RepID=UPI0030B52A30